MRKLKNEELKRLTPEQYRASAKKPVTIILDNVRSLNNIGSVFRTADGFRIDKVILCGISTTPPHRDIHKTALGAEASVKWDYYSETIDAVRTLREEGHIIISVEQVDSSIRLDEFVPGTNKPLALVFGHEVKGVQQEVVNESDYCIEIPQYGTKHSLNISVSVGIVLWEIGQKLKLYP